VDSFSELHRLAFVVGNIDNDTSVVPKGAFAIDENNKLEVGVSFKGEIFLTKNFGIFFTKNICRKNFSLFLNFSLLNFIHGILK
jgi:hypothetical protein